MILTKVAEIMTTRIPARSKRQAMEWSLVLISQGIESTVDSVEELGWGLIVPGQDCERAVDILRQYHTENRHWPWRQRISPKGVLFDWASLGWVLLVGLFFWIQSHAATDITGAGLMDAVAVSHGEWWRLFTAIFLHADAGHFAMNASIGFFLVGLTMGNFGTGVGLLAAYFAGTGGNIATWLIYSQGHAVRVARREPGIGRAGASGRICQRTGARECFGDWSKTHPKYRGEYFGGRCFLRAGDIAVVAGAGQRDGITETGGTPVLRVRAVSPCGLAAVFEGGADFAGGINDSFKVAL